MKVEKRTQKRKPLFDCTNIITPHISAFINLRKPALSTNESDQDSLKYDTSTGSNNAGNPRVGTQPSTPPRQRSLVDSGNIDCQNSGIATVYRRRRSLKEGKNKGKSVDAEIPFSYPPAGRIRCAGEEPNEEHGDVILSKTDMVPHPKSKKKQRHSLPKDDVNRHTLPQDFIHQQRAYFAEIDAFELPEEFVSYSDME